MNQTNHTTLIQLLNDSDKRYQNENTPNLAKERSQIRLKLASISQNPQEKEHFLMQAVAICEQALFEFDEIETDIYLQISIALTNGYLALFELKNDKKYLTIAEQIIRPLSHHENSDIYQLMININELKNNTALVKYWQNKYKKLQMDKVEMVTDIVQ